MKLFLALLLALTGCGNPVEDCPGFPRTDCCTADEQCAAFYGSELGYCAHPDRYGGGTCSSCARDADCRGKGDQRCVNTDAASGQLQCVDVDSCYEGSPFPGVTPCG